ncbi:unnamed protein product [Cuscuta campestris]|nr:unnamed protein product [Cuscuta campestris]
MVLVAFMVTRPEAAGDAETSSKRKLIVVTNNHTSYLSLRCFSFDNAFDVQHLNSWEQFKFMVDVRVIFPSATMWNCSTNMGTFVAFRHDYACSNHPSNTCQWRFDEHMTYVYDPTVALWVAVEYNPNYESLNRGGVIRGYYVN